jgi:arsenate reductase
MSDVVIYHNPKCGTSRNVLALLQEKGLQPQVVEYVKAGWTREQLEGLLARMKASPRDVLRVNGTNAEALGLTAAEATDKQLLEAMVREPILVNRPIVATPKGAALCRPAERVLELL